MSRHQRDIAKTIGVAGDVLVLASDDGPKLPAMQAIAVPEMKERVKIIVRHHVFFPGLAINREHHKKDVMKYQPVFQMPVERHQRRVVVVRLRGTLLEIKRIEGESFFRGL